MNHPCIQAERVAVLEAQNETLKETLEAVFSEVKSINAQLTRYKGFLGGIFFILGGLPVLWSLLKDWILRHWS